MGVQSDARQTIGDAVLDYAREGGSSGVMARYLMLAAVERVVGLEQGRAHVEVIIVTPRGNTTFLTDSADPAPNLEHELQDREIAALIGSAWRHEITAEEALIRIDGLVRGEAPDAPAQLQGVALGLAAE